jgi:hypothetical protein
MGKISDCNWREGLRTIRLPVVSDWYRGLILNRLLVYAYDDSLDKILNTIKNRKSLMLLSYSLILLASD